MKKYGKIFKVTYATLLLVSFLTFTGIANAQAIGNDIDISGCAAEVVSNFLVSSLASVGASAATSFTPRTKEGIILTGTTAAQASAVAAGTLSSVIAVPVNDLAANAQMAISNVINNADALFQSTSKMNLDAIAYGIAQCMLDAMTENTVRWIQGGFKGSPNFAVNTSNLFLDLSDAVLGDLANQIASLGACEFSLNFIDDLANSVESSAPKREKLKRKIECPFDASLTFSASEFYGPVNRFSWSMFETALGDSGNPYGVKVVTAEEAERRMAEASKSTERRLDWSNGFADIIDYANCNYPDKEIESQANDESFSPAIREMYQREYCPTATPGKIIGDKLMKQLNLEEDRIGFADNMNKIISAFIKQLTKETISGVFKEANRAQSSIRSMRGMTPTSGTTPTRQPTGNNQPSVIINTLPASQITSISAMLNGVISSNGTTNLGSTWFEWGDSINLMNSSSTVVTYGAGELAVPTPFSQTITGLNASTTYYFRANGGNSNIGYSSGGVMSFTTE